MENNPGNDRAVRPKFYLQNRSNWCWAAAAKPWGCTIKTSIPALDSPSSALRQTPNSGQWGLSLRRN